MAATMSVLVYITLYLCLLHQTEQSRVMSRKNHEFPFKSLCSRTCGIQAEQPAQEDFPLYECSCSRSCSVFGDCCYDSPYRNTTTWYKADVICVSVVGHGQYKAISGCPPDHLADFCKDGLGHLPPVTSKGTNITYANKFCAICNGESENLITWNVELRCPADLNDGIDEESNATARYIYRSGDFWSLNEEDGSKRQCMFYVHYDNFSFMEGLELRLCNNIKKMSDCSPSWRDLSILKLCRSYEDPVYFHNTAYQNAHCARCNYLNAKYAECIPFNVKSMLQMGLVDLSVDRFCQTRGSDACIKHLSDMLKGQKGRGYSLADLLNISEKGCVPPKGRKCCKGEAFDFRSKRCKKLQQS